MSLNLKVYLEISLTNFSDSNSNFINIWDFGGEWGFYDTFINCVALFKYSSTSREIKKK